MRNQPTFEVDKAGLAKILARRGIEFAVLELIQNALDEDGTTTVNVELVAEARGHYNLVVTDDNPEGFSDLAHAYTLFAESRKKANPEKRGRFNLGEKLVIAVARELVIKTTKGTVRFDSNGRHHGHRSRTDCGTIVDALLRMSHEDAARTEQAVHSVFVPPAVSLTFNGKRVASAEPLRTITATLPTEVADDEGYLRPSERKTTLRVFPVQDGATPTLYEMGIPVVALDCAWHVDVGQKVPLNTDRDNVTPAYARRVRAEVLNAMHAELTNEASTAAWVDDVMESPLVSPEAVETVVSQRYGEKRVIRDPSDPEGTKLAVSLGYSVIEPGSFSKSAWSNIRAAGAALPAGQVTPSPRPFSNDPEAERLKTIPHDQWTQGMRDVCAYSIALFEELHGGKLGVTMANDFGWPFRGSFGSNRLTFNVARFGRAWFDAPDFVELNRFLIHEFGHAYASDHLSSEYHDALCRLGAKLAELALEHPELVGRFRRAK